MTNGLAQTDQQARYEAALQILASCEQLLWLIWSGFALPNAVLLGVLVDGTTGEHGVGVWHVGRFVGAIIGLFTCIPWFASYMRNSELWQLRMAQARECEPRDWDLLANTGRKFASGECVEVGGQHFKLPWLSRKLRTYYAVPILMAVFPISYVLIAIATAPWWPAAPVTP